MPTSFRRTLAVLLLATVLLAPWAASSEPAGRSSHQDKWNLFAHLWNAVAALWGDNGCSVDPFGRCGGTNATPAPPESLDNGCGMDPYGA